MFEDFAGKWLDKRTGKTVLVRDAIMDGDNMVILSSAGSIDPEVFQNFFVKMSDEEFSATNIQPQVSGQQLLNVVNSGLEGEDRITLQQKITLDTPIGGPSENTPIKKESNTTVSEKHVEVVSEPKVSENYKLIEKVFTKHETKPIINFNVNLSEWPIEQLSMLINVFDVSLNEISDYIIKNYLNENILVEQFSDYLKTAIENDK